VKLQRALAESFKMLLEEPRLFVPKLVSTSVSTVWLLSFAELYAESVTPVDTSALTLYLGSAPFIVFLGVFVSVMLAEMVDGKQVLYRSFKETLLQWKTLVMVSVALMVSGILLYIPLTAGLGLYILTGSLPVLIAGGAATILLMLLVSFSVFFLPITIVKKEGTLESIMESISASRSNPREVTVILLFSLALLGLAFTMQGTLQKLGMIGFATSRLVSAVVTTYLFVVSPKMYLDR
jgi:hypothetical protein